MLATIILAYVLILFMVGILFLVWYVRRWSKPGTVLIEILQPSGHSVTFKAKIVDSAKGKMARVRHENTSYLVIRETKYVHPTKVAFGLVTVDKFHYIAGLANPIDWDSMRIGDAVSSEDVHLARENHIASDAMKVVAKELLSPVMIMVIMIGAVLVSSFFLYNGIGGKIEATNQILIEQSRENQGVGR